MPLGFLVLAAFNRISLKTRRPRRQNILARGWVLSGLRVTSVQAPGGFCLGLSRMYSRLQARAFSLFSGLDSETAGPGRNEREQTNGAFAKNGLRMRGASFPVSVARRRN